MPRMGRESTGRVSALTGPVLPHFWLRSKPRVLERSVRAPPSKSLLCCPDQSPELVRIFRRRLQATDPPKPAARFRSLLAVAFRQSASPFLVEQAVLIIE